MYRGTNNRDFQKRAEGKTKGWESFISYLTFLLNFLHIKFVLTIIKLRIWYKPFSTELRIKNKKHKKTSKTVFEGKQIILVIAPFFAITLFFACSNDQSNENIWKFDWIYKLTLKSTPKTYKKKKKIEVGAPSTPRLFSYKLKS